jgi:ring-1,2-phenylacetyl-CoA epoxidase subunit PaaE
MTSKADMAQICKATITLDGNHIEIDIKEESILQTLLDAGYDPPFSCTSGVCTTCMARLTKGSVEMDVNYGLDEGEVAEGYILTCQSHPTSDEIEVTYDI